MDFGKYRGKTFKWIQDNDISYLEWCGRQTCDRFKNILKFIEDHVKLIEFVKPKSIRCSKLAPILYQTSFKYVLNSLQFETYKYKPLTTARLLGLDSPILGIFIDYLLRYRIAKTHNIPFYDDRAYRMDRSRLQYVIKNDATLTDILMLSDSHNQCFGRDYVYDPPLEEINMSLFDETPLMDFVKSERFHDTVIHLNPAIGVDYIYADCDIIAGTELIDIKCSKYSKPKSDFIQLLIYAALCRVRKIKIDKLTIYNPLLGEVMETKINDELLDEIIKYIQLDTSKVEDYKIRLEMLDKRIKELLNS